MEVVGGYSLNFCLTLLGTRGCIFLSILIEIYIITWYNIENVEFTIGDLL